MQISAILKIYLLFSSVSIVLGQCNSRYDTCSDVQAWCPSYQCSTTNGIGTYNCFTYSCSGSIGATPSPTLPPTNLPPTRSPTPQPTTSTPTSGMLSAIDFSTSEIDLSNFNVVRSYSSAITPFCEGTSPNSCELGCVSGGHKLIHSKSGDLAGLVPNSFPGGTCSCAIFYWTPKTAESIGGSYYTTNYLILYDNTKVIMSVQGNGGKCKFRSNNVQTNSPTAKTPTVSPTTAPVQTTDQNNSSDSSASGNSSSTILAVSISLGLLIVFGFIVCALKSKSDSKDEPKESGIKETESAVPVKTQKPASTGDKSNIAPPRLSSTMTSANFNSSTIRAKPNLEMQNAPRASTRISVNAGQMPTQTPHIPQYHPNMQMPPNLEMQNPNTRISTNAGQVPVSLPGYYAQASYPQISPAQYAQMMSASQNFSMSLPSAQFVPNQQYQIALPQIYISSPQPQNIDNFPNYPAPAYDPQSQR